MQVKDLLEKLEQCDPEANVLLVIQPSYPLEESVWRVIEREDYLPPKDEDGDDNYTYGRTPKDVLLLSGGMVRYGSRKAFER